MMNKIIVHSIGNTKQSIFALELLTRSGATIYAIDPEESVKYNKYFNPFVKGSTLEAAIKELKSDLGANPPVSLNTSGRKLLINEFPNAKKFPDKDVSYMTVLDEYKPPEIETLYDFVLREPTTCGDPGLGSKHNSCPFMNAIVDTPTANVDVAPTANVDVTPTANVYVYTKPFSNFTKFCFNLDGYYYPTLEHLIMHIRLWSLVDEPMRDLAEEDPEDDYVVKYLSEMNLANATELMAQDPKELAYETIHKAIMGNWGTGVMKRCVAARNLRYKNLTASLFIDRLIERTSTLYQYALHRKVLSSPSLTYFFLLHKDYNWYEVAPIDSVWVIDEEFRPDLKDDIDYLDRLQAAAKKYGNSRNVFGKYLQNTAAWLGELENTTS